MTAFLSGTSYAAIAAATATKATPGTVQVFSTPGTFTYTPPAGLKEAYVVAVGGGAGAGGGQVNALGVARGGGGGGGAGGWSDCTIKATQLGSTETVIVGAGGAGGALRTSQSGGFPGTNGGASSFGAWIAAQGGNLGQGGGISQSGVVSTGGAGAVTGGSGSFFSTVGAAANPTRPAGLAPAGGSAGGSFDAANNAYAGSDGGQPGGGTPGTMFGDYPSGNSASRTAGDISGAGGGAGGAPASYSTVLGPELCPNGVFNDATGWSLGAGWTVANGKLTGNIGSSGGPVATVNGVTLTVGKKYRVTYTISSIVGSFSILDGNGANGVSRSAVGTYTEDFDTAGGSLNLRPRGAGFVGTIDNVSVREVINLLTNGNFSNGSTGWTDASSAPATAVVSGGVLTLTGDGTNTARYRQSITTVVGRTYRLTLDISGNTCPIIVGTTVGGSDLAVNGGAVGVGTTLTFVATTTTTYLQLYHSAANATVVDNVFITEENAIQNGTFTTDTTGWTPANASLAVVGGQLEITCTGSPSGHRAMQQVTVKANTLYQLTVTQAGGTAPNQKQIRVGATNDVNGEVFNTTLGVGTFTVLFNSLSNTSLWIKLGYGETALGQTSYWDDVVMREVTSTIPGGAGGTGGFPGGGGGGGGASMNGVNSGAGGAGAGGTVIVFESY